MASVFIFRVKPGNLVLTVLILMVTRHTHSTTSITATESSTKKTESTSRPISNKDNLTFESSCAALNWSEAETDCIKKGASIFTIEDLSEAIGGRVLEKAKAEHATIWIMGNGTICQRVFNVSFLPANCSDINYYVCKKNTSGSSEWYVPCQEGSTGTPTQGTVLAISVVKCGTLALAVVSIALGCDLLQRRQTVPPGNHQAAARGGQTDENNYGHLETRNTSESSDYATLHDPGNIGQMPAIQLDDQ